MNRYTPSPQQPASRMAAKTTVAIVAAVLFASGSSFHGAPPAESRAGEAGVAGEGCAAAAAARSADSARKAHAYFEALVARPDCMLAYSLRDQAQLDKYKHAKSAPAAITYDPAGDRDPRHQDAAKLVVPANKVSLRNQLRLPMSTADGTTTLVTWDAWFGAEFRYETTGISTYKTFQFTSPGSEKKWFGVRTRFKQTEEKQARRIAQGGASNGAPGDEKPQPGGGARPRLRQRNLAKGVAGGGDGPIGMVDTRGSAARPHGPNVTKATPLAPQVGSFAIRPETWTRYWVLIDQRANDFDLVSVWVADENHDPVQIIDGLQFTVRESVGSFWFEYNTSDKLKTGLPERVGYVRNVAILRNAKDVASLLQRPLK